MTKSTYEALVTTKIDEICGPEFEYPDSWQSDVDACFMRRIPVEQAAEELVAEYTQQS